MNKVRLEWLCGDCRQEWEGC